MGIRRCLVSFRIIPRICLLVLHAAAKEAVPLSCKSSNLEFSHASFPARTNCCRLAFCSGLRYGVRRFTSPFNRTCRCTLSGSASQIGLLRLDIKWGNLTYQASVSFEMRNMAHPPTMYCLKLLEKSTLTECCSSSNWFIYELVETSVLKYFVWEN